jgi:hypothetical protein
MPDENDLSRLTDEEFIRILKAKEKGRSWTLRELFEIERRGNGFLSKDPELQEAIRLVQSGVAKGITDALAPTLKSLQVRAELARQLSEQFEGIGKNLNAAVGQNALSAWQKQSTAYQNLMDTARISAVPEVTRQILAGSFAFENALKKSQNAIGSWLEKYSNPILAPSQRASITTEISNNVLKNALVFKQISDHLQNTSNRIPTTLKYDQLEESVDRKSLDLAAIDPKVPTVLAAPLITQIETEQVVSSKQAADKVEENAAETITQLKALNQTMTRGAIPRWATFIAMGAGVVAALAGVVAAVEGFLLLMRK